MKNTADDLLRLSDGGTPMRYHFARAFLMPTAEAEAPRWSPEPISLLDGFRVRCLRVNLRYEDRSMSSMVFSMN